MRSTTVLLLALLAAPALAQTPGNCEHGVAQADLEESGVFARLFNNGNLFFGNATTDGDGYFVGDAPGGSMIYAANVWAGGFVGDELRVAGGTYLTFEFWPGPLQDGATLPDAADCSAYDRIWTVSAPDLARYDATGEATADLADWPAALGAEVVDGDGVPGNYDLAAGDRPRLFGSQTAFWVMNDVGNEHVRTGSEPIGLEVQVTAFAVSSEDPALDQTTFYRYRLVNRNDAPLEAAYFSVWMDPALGDAGDDYVGVDTTRGLAFVYNADATDSRFSTPPAFGADFLDGMGSTRWTLKGGFSEVRGVPSTAAQHYHAMQGRWNDGTPLTEGGIGYETAGPETVWHFPGDPVTGAGWSEVSADNFADDRYYLATTPPFTLAPGEAHDVHLAFVFGQGADHLDSITALRAASDAVQGAFDDSTLFDARFPVGSDEGPGTPPAARLEAYPNPSAGGASVNLTLAEASAVRVAAYDVLGREVALLQEGLLGAGTHALTFEAAGLPAGLYVVRAEGKGWAASRRVTLVR